MICPSCHYENPETAQFCGDCGQPCAPTTVCQACGSQNPPGQKFCNGCGRRLTVAAPSPSPAPDPRSYTPKHLAEKILTSRSALEGERKTITALFAEIKGSMELLEDLDPEEARRVIDPALQDEAKAIQVRERHRAIALRADASVCGRSRYGDWGFHLERHKGGKR